MAKYKVIKNNSIKDTRPVEQSDGSFIFASELSPKIGEVIELGEQKIKFGKPIFDFVINSQFITIAFQNE